MKLEDLYNVNIADLTSETIRKYASFASSQANRRLNTWRLYDEDDTIPHAVRQARDYLYSENQSKFTFKPDQDLNKQKKELARAINFLQDRTSTKAGWNETKSDVIDDVKLKTGVQISPENFDDVFKAFEKLKQLDKNAGTKELKYQLWRLLDTELEDKDESPEELALRLHNSENTLSELIKQNEEAFRYATENVSSLFDW